MAPARNAKGELVGYLVANVGLVPLAEATAPGFELCKVELKAHNKGVELLNELKASGDEAVADIPIPRLPPYLANCG